MTRPVELPAHEDLEARPSKPVSARAANSHNGGTEGSGYLLVLSQPPLLPQAPANIFGRDAIIDDLVGLAERFASVTLFGAGGTGKSTIALTLLHHNQIVTRFGKHRHFIRCDDLVNSLGGFTGRLSEAIGARPSMDMAQLRSHLALSPPCALVLDGVDYILDPLAPGANEIVTAIEELGRYKNVFLLATSRMEVRIPDFRHQEVPTLRVECARDTFYSRCSLGRSAAVDKLLTELDLHPLSTDLLASVVREKGWDEPGLLKAWSDNKTSVLKVPGRQSLEENIESILLTPTIRELGIAAHETLKAIARHPGGVQESKLERTFPGIPTIGEAVNALCKFSVIYRQEGFVKMLSPFRLHFLESNGPVYHHLGKKPIRRFRSATKSEHEKVRSLAPGSNNC